MAPTAETDCRYTLTGFGEFLEWRTLRFVEPMPKIRVCRLCGVVASVGKLLPCTHVLCETCKDQVADRGLQCPIDGTTFVAEDVQEMPFTRRELGERHVHCINDAGSGAAGCPFVGKLSSLEEHFIAHCVYGTVRCSKCRGSVLRKDLVEHYVNCTDDEKSRPADSAPNGKVTVDAADAGRLATTLRDIQHGLKNAVEGTPRVDMRLGSLQKKASSVEDLLEVLDPKGSSPEASQHSSRRNSAAASSKTLMFCGIDSMRKSQDNLLLPLDGACTLANYTFTLQCKFEKSWCKLSAVSFLFTLCVGDRDDFVEWPFAKQVHISILHPTKEGRDIQVPFKICPEKNAVCLKRPQSGVLQKGILSEKISWKYIEKKELFSKDSLIVYVELE
ncbi:uncharacterized protein LOC144107848 [Amblyomma americanum]